MIRDSKFVAADPLKWFQRHVSDDEIFQAERGLHAQAVGNAGCESG
jgi:hypothetical protein